MAHFFGALLVGLVRPFGVEVMFHAKPPRGM